MYFVIPYIVTNNLKWKIRWEHSISKTETTFRRSKVVKIYSSLTIKYKDIAEVTVFFLAQYENIQNVTDPLQIKRKKSTFLKYISHTKLWIVYTHICLVSVHIKPVLTNYLKPNNSCWMKNKIRCINFR